MAGAGKASYYLFTKERATGIERLTPKLPAEIRKALGESALDQSAALQQQRDANRQEMQAKEQQKQQLEEAAQEVQTLREEMDALRDQIRQLEADR